MSKRSLSFRNRIINWSYDLNKKREIRRIWRGSTIKRSRSSNWNLASRRKKSSNSEKIIVYYMHRRNSVEIATFDRRRGLSQIWAKGPWRVAEVEIVAGGVRVLGGKKYQRLVCLHLMLALILQISNKSESTKADSQEKNLNTILSINNKSKV